MDRLTYVADILRRLEQQGWLAKSDIGWSDFVVGIDSRLAGQQVLVIARDYDLAIYGQTGLLRRLTIDTTRRYQPTGKPPGRPRLSVMS